MLPGICVVRMCLRANADLLLNPGVRIHGNRATGTSNDTRIDGFYCRIWRWCCYVYINIYIYISSQHRRHVTHTYKGGLPICLPTNIAEANANRGSCQSVSPRGDMHREGQKKKRFSHQTTTKITRNFSHEFRCIYFFRRFFPATAYKIIRRRFKKNAELHRQRATKVSHLLWKTSTIHIAHWPYHPRNQSDTCICLSFDKRPNNLCDERNTVLLCNCEVKLYAYYIKQLPSW